MDKHHPILAIGIFFLFMLNLSRADEYESKARCPLPLTSGASYDPFYATYIVGSTVKISCYGERVLLGTSSLTCRPDGEWDSVLPSCEDVEQHQDAGSTSCPRRIMANGWITPYKNAYEWFSVVTFKCSQGYELIGQPTSDCLPGGVWSSDVPTCRAAAPSGCLSPKFLHGTFSPVLSGGRKLHHVGTKMTFRCLGEFRMQGSQYATCQENGRWTRIPDCIDGCRTQTIRNGKTYPAPQKRGEYYAFGSVITVSCKLGHLVAGQPNATCMSNGVWSTLLVCTDGCVEPNIPHITTLPRPIRGANIYKVESVVRFKCSKGLLLRGAKSTKCMSGNKWNKVLPTCSGTIAFCKYPTELKMGSFRPVQKQYGVGSSIAWTCHNNHLLIGAETSTCTAAGVFDPPKPVCQQTRERIDFKPGEPGSYDYSRRGCSRPKLAVGGAISPRRAFYPLAKEVEFACRKGYQMVGTARAICQNYGFTFRPPACRRVQCIPPSLPKNGQFRETTKDHYYYGDKMHYVCDQNYVMSGSRYTTCKDDGKFFPGPPTCRAPSCRFDCKYVKGRTCQCDIGCRYERNCCEDFEQFCRKLYY